MRGRRGFFSLFTSLPDHPEEKPDLDGFQSRRRRRHSSGDRETWSRKIEYYFATLGYAVGLGNIWRFPYLCYRNGRGAFLLPYIIALFAVGFPILYMEMAFGQFASLGTVTIWRICPLFKGIGYSIIVVLMLVNTYYNVLIAYSLFYMFASITNELPWSHCNNNWNTENCIVSRKRDEVNSSISDMFNMSTTTSLPVNVTSALVANQLKTPTEEFFERHLLQKSEGIHDLGSVSWPLIVCLAVSWSVCFMCLFKGIKSMGKAVIFTTLFSYAILTVLFIRGVTLPGASDGIIYYLKPDFAALTKISVWGEASAQAFASLTLGGGGWITLSSYNKFNNRCNRDAIIVGIGNALTSIYSGFVIFSVLGYMAYIKGVDVDDVTAKGPSLAFIAYPEGLAMIPGAPFWSICFFFMMFTVGLDSLFGQVETMAAGIIDEYPETLRPNRKLFTLFLCIFMFFCGIPLLTKGGIFIVTLMDWYTLLFSFSIISLFELLVIIYIYGYKRFSNDIQLMVGQPPSIFFQIMWRFGSPLVLMLVIAFLAVKYVPPSYGDYTFPPEAESIGWLLALGPCLCIPIVALYKLFHKVALTDILHLPTCADARQRAKESLLTPSMEWGPAQLEIRRKFSYDPKKGSVADDDRLAGVKQGESFDDDEVFGGADSAVKLDSVSSANGSNGEKDKLVHFQDEDEKKAQNNEESKPEKVEETAQ